MFRICRAIFWQNGESVGGLKNVASEVDGGGYCRDGVVARENYIEPSSRRCALSGELKRATNDYEKWLDILDH
jgi:hypothetical protein